MIDVELNGNMALTATREDGATFTMDAHADSGGEGKGVTPVEALYASVAACTAMDVISILRKKKQKVTSYKVHVEGERSGPEGEYPRPITKITVKHVVQGENVDPKAVARAVELSDEKYCTVAATLRTGPEIETGWEIV